MSDFQPYVSDIERAVNDAVQSTESADESSERLATEIAELDESIEAAEGATESATSAWNDAPKPISMREIHSITGMGSYVLPTMSASRKGGAKLGTGLGVVGETVSMNKISVQRVHEVTGV